MEIEFGVQEYFNELKLMDAQYGREEELYPWVYMLLQMSECKKREILKEWYQGVSIRDVHNFKSYMWLSNNPRDEMLYRVREKLGAPDFIILDMGINKFYGCVEIKLLNTKLNMGRPKETIESSLEAEKYTIEYRVNKVNLTHDEITCIMDKIKAELKQKLGETVLSINYSQNKNVYTFCAEIKEITKELEKKLCDYRLMKEANAKKDYDIDIKNGKIKMRMYVKPWKEKFGWTEERQIISHLEKFKKVLYTNGLEFYYLVLNEKNIDVKKIADLRPMYAKFKDNSVPTPQLLLAASAEWDRLIAGLTSIDWHQGPVAEI